jgi:hypothetical protein
MQCILIFPSGKLTRRITPLHEDLENVLASMLDDPLLQHLKGNLVLSISRRKIRWPLLSN